MGLRDAMNNNSSVVTIIAVVVLVIALGIIVMTNKGPGSSFGGQDTYFFNTATGKLYKESPKSISPVDTSDGPKTGVLAYVYSCGQCGDYAGMTPDEVKSANAFIGHLEKYSDTAHALILASQAGNQPPPEQMGAMQEILIKRPQDANWVPHMGPAGIRIQSDEASQCPDGQVTPCQP